MNIFIHFCIIPLILYNLMYQFLLIYINYFREDIYTFNLHSKKIKMQLKIQLGTIIMKEVLLNAKNV